MAAATPQQFKGSVILLEHARKMQAARDEKHRKEIAAQQSRGFAAAQLNRLTEGLRVTAERIDHELRHDLDALRGRPQPLQFRPAPDRCRPPGHLAQPRRARRRQRHPPRRRSRYRQPTGQLLVQHRRRSTSSPPIRCRTTPTKPAKKPPQRQKQHRKNKSRSPHPRKKPPRSAKKRRPVKTPPTAAR